MNGKNTSGTRAVKKRGRSQLRSIEKILSLLNLYMVSGDQTWGWKDGIRAVVWMVSIPETAAPSDCEKLPFANVIVFIGQGQPPREGAGVQLLVGGSTLGLPLGQPCIYIKGIHLDHDLPFRIRHDQGPVCLPNATSFITSTLRSTLTFCMVPETFFAMNLFCTLFVGKVVLKRS